MKRNIKTALILALGLGLITGANTDTKAYADTEVRYVETKDELGRINWAISYLETSNKALDKAIEDAYKRIENSDPKTPTEEEKEILEKAKADREKSEIILAKLKSYKLKEEKPSDKDDETDKPSDGKTDPKEDDKNPETPEDKPSEGEQTPPKEEDKPTDEDKPSEEKPEITKTTLEEEIPFETKRAVNDPNLETRIVQAGSNGFVEYELTYEGNKLIDKKVINKVEPTDQIIETYVKVKDAEIGTREVEDKSKPIYKTEYQQKAFVRGYPAEEWIETGEENIQYWEFDSYEEANAFFSKHEIMGNYGTLDKYKEIKTFVGYETVTETYEISPAVYEWR